MGTEATRLPAPGKLAIVQAFINTVDFEAREEELRNPEDLRAWLADRGLMRDDEPVSVDDVRRAVEMREALRALLDSHNGAPADQEAVATLNRQAVDSCLDIHFDLDGGVALLSVAPGVQGALGRLLAIVYTAGTDGTWERLKTCRSGTCRWAFYDHSKNHSGAWCSMAGCGSRHKSQEYRDRRRTAAAKS
jgi:predicted RNA-binding Zn ribbon-like protein